MAHSRSLNCTTNATQMIATYLRDFAASREEKSSLVSREGAKTRRSNVMRWTQDFAGVTG